MCHSDRRGLCDQRLAQLELDYKADGAAQPDLALFGHRCYF